MWKPALFLITVVLITPNGRGALGEYVHRASYLFAGSFYGDMAIVALALVFLGLFLLVFCKSSKNPDEQWILRRVRGQEPVDALSHRIR